MYYIQPDHLNSPRLITDANNNVVWQWDNSDPFGNNLPNENPSGLGVFKFGLRFPGMVADEETGTFYNYYRDCYDPATGRYCQSDPIGLAGGSLSPYVYVNNQPTRYIDPDGLQVAVPATPPPVPGNNGSNGAGNNRGPFDLERDMPIPPSSRPNSVNVPASFCFAAPAVCAAIAIANADSGKDFWNDLDRCRGGGTRTNGEKGRKRRYYEWDHTHGDVEVYNDRGEHLGSADPQTGNMTKPPVPGRKIDR